MRLSPFTSWPNRPKQSAISIAGTVLFSKERLYPSIKCRTADDILEAYVRQLTEIQQSAHVTIAWQGGEPTLRGLAFFRLASALAGKYLRRRMTLERTPQINRILQDEKWCEFLRANTFLVGLSMDGPQARHDVCCADEARAPNFFARDGYRPPDA